ncbi:MatE [Rosistilla ulvae]|uniref:MatE n=1 Tax=Rosistilla ulvae TaxID=1930277 RepID=A0A517LWP1_9BACT|nr:MATE family efflux transporter [Rosistilla ulvae]QDS87043.1 MatE [Rosistilla ulvae]
MTGELVLENQGFVLRNKRLVKYASSYIVSIASLFCLTAMWKLSATAFSPSDFELFALCRRGLSTLLPFIELGIPLAVTQYVALDHVRQGNRNEKSILVAALFWCSAFGLVAIATSWLLAGRIVKFANLPVEFAQYLPLVASWAVGTAFFALASGWWHAKRQFIRASMARVLMFAIPLPIIALGNTSMHVKMGGVALVVSGVFGGVLLNILRTCDHGFDLNNFRTQLRNTVAFGVPRSVGRASLQLMLWLPVMFAAKHGGNLNVSAVAFGISLIVAVGGVVSPVGALIHSTLSVKIEQKRFNEAKKIVLGAFCFSATISVLATILLWDNLPYVVSIMLTEQYVEIVPLLRVLLIAQVPLTICSVMQCTLDVINNSPLNLRAGIVSLWVCACLVWVSPDADAVLYSLVGSLSLRAVLVLRDILSTFRSCDQVLRELTKEANSDCGMATQCT